MAAKYTEAALRDVAGLEMLRLPPQHDTERQSSRLVISRSAGE